MVFEQLGPGQDKWAPAQMGSGKMGTRTNRSGLGQGNNCPGPICPGITNTAKTAFAQEKRFVQLKVEQF